jgi:beta-lactamase class A
LNQISHGITAIQGARFYYRLDTIRLVGPELTPKMKQILADPAIDHKFVKGLKTRPGVKLYRKSGTSMPTVHWWNTMRTNILL